MFGAPGTEGGPLAGVLLCRSASGTYRAPWLGSCSVDQPSGTYRGPWLGSCSVALHQALTGAPWLGSCSAVLCQALEEPASLLFSCQCWHCGERETMVMAPSPMHESAVLPCFHGCPAFLHRHFPHSLLPHIPSVHLATVHSSPALGLLHNRQAPAPSCCAF